MSGALLPVSFEFFLNGGTGCSDWTGATFFDFLNGQSPSNDLWIHTQNIIHKPSDSYDVGALVSDRTHILLFEGKVEEDIWPMGHQ